MMQSVFCDMFSAVSAPRSSTFAKVSVRGYGVEVQQSPKTLLLNNLILGSFTREPKCSGIIVTTQLLPTQASGQMLRLCKKQDMQNDPVRVIYLYINSLASTWIFGAAHPQELVIVQFHSSFWALCPPGRFQGSLKNGHLPPRAAGILPNASSANPPGVLAVSTEREPRTRSHLPVAQERGQSIVVRHDLGRPCTGDEQNTQRQPVTSPGSFNSSRFHLNSNSSPFRHHVSVPFRHLVSSSHGRQGAECRTAWTWKDNRHGTPCTSTLQQVLPGDNRCPETTC